VRGVGIRLPQVLALDWRAQDLPPAPDSLARLSWPDQRASPSKGPPAQEFARWAICRSEVITTPAVWAMSDEAILGTGTVRETKLH
jgi:hypothetical protein